MKEEGVGVGGVEDVPHVVRPSIAADLLGFLALSPGPPGPQSPPGSFLGRDVHSGKKKITLLRAIPTNGIWLSGIGVGEGGSWASGATWGFGCRV